MSEATPADVQDETPDVVPEVDAPEVPEEQEPAGESDGPAEEPSSGTALETRESATPAYVAQGTLPSDREWNSLVSLSKAIAASGMQPKVNGRPMEWQAIATIGLKGRELGIPPMMALSHIHVIEGRPTASAELMRALVQKAGHVIFVREQSPELATVVAKRREWSETMPLVEVTYTIDEAKEAGLTGKSNWKKHPTDMLVARATSRMCRQVFADVLMGASYTPDELDVEVVYDVEGEIEGIITDEGRDQPAQRRSGGGGDETAGSISDGQKKKLSILLRELDIRGEGDEGSVLYRAGLMAKYGVDSIKDLSQKQATVLIDVLSNGTVDRETGEVTRTPAQLADAWLKAGSEWLAQQEAAEQEDGGDEDIVDAEVIEEDGDE